MGWMVHIGRFLLYTAWSHDPARPENGDKAGRDLRQQQHERRQRKEPELGRLARRDSNGGLPELRQPEQEGHERQGDRERMMEYTVATALDTAPALWRAGGRVHGHRTSV